MTVQSIRDIFAEKLIDGDFSDDGNLEIINASFIADSPMIFGEPNEDWNQRELKWYLSQSLNIADIPPPVPAIWSKVAGHDGSINSNYGWAIFSRQNFNQFDRAILSLRANRNSRQAVMIYIRPTMHKDSISRGMRDFMCTYSTQLLIRSNKLHYIVNMRSNDAGVGYPGDLAWHEKIHRLSLDQISKHFPEVKIGSLYWNANSLHIYPSQFYLVDHFVKTGELSISKSEYRILNPSSKWCK